MYVSTVEELVQQDPSLAEVVANRPVCSAKALAVSNATGITGITGILNIILQLLSSFGICGTPTAAVVNQRITAPNNLQQLGARRLVRRNYRGNLLAQEMVFHGLLQVGATCSVADTTAMYGEANVGKPPLQ